MQMSYTCKHLRPRSTGGNDLVRGRAAAKCLLFLLPSDKSPRVLSLPLPVADAAYNFVVVVVVVVLCCCSRFLSFDVCFFVILVIQLLCVALKAFRIFGCLRGKKIRRGFFFSLGFLVLRCVCFVTLIIIFRISSLLCVIRVVYCSTVFTMEDEKFGISGADVTR